MLVEFNTDQRHSILKRLSVQYSDDGTGALCNLTKYPDEFEAGGHSYVISALCQLRYLAIFCFI